MKEQEKTNGNWIGTRWQHLWAGILIQAIVLWISLILMNVSFIAQDYARDATVSLQRDIWVNFRADRVYENSNTYSVAKANATRILLPAIYASAEKLFGLDWKASIAIIRFFTIYLSLNAFLIYLCNWVPLAYSLVGCLLLSSSIPITFSLWSEIPTDFVELLCFTLFLHNLYRRKIAFCYLIFVLATLNRELSFFLPGLLLLGIFPTARVRGLLHFFAMTAIWFLVVGLIRYKVGLDWHFNHGNSWAVNSMILASLIRHPHPYHYALYYWFMFLPAWGYWGYYLITGFSKQRDFLWREALAVPFMLVVYLCFGGFLNEPRELIPLYPILFPPFVIAISRILTVKELPNESLHQTGAAGSLSEVSGLGG